jgi:hexosaminidase
VRLDLSEGPVEVRARLVTPEGRLGPIRSASFRQAVLRPADPPSGGGQGLEARYRQGSFRSVEEMLAAPVLWTRTMDEVGVPEEAAPEFFGLQLRGFVEVPEDGIYTFHLASDDGSILRIGGEVAVDHDGLHGMTERSGQVALARGSHPLEVTFFQSGGGVGLSLEVTTPSGARSPLPAAWLREPGG